MVSGCLRKKLIPLLLTALLSLLCQAQQPSKIDSLTKALKTQKEDTNKANTLNALSRELWQKARYAEAKQNADDALALAEIIKFDAGKAAALNNVGVIYAYQGNYPEALKNHLASLRINESIGNKKGMADCYNAIAAIYYNEGNYPEALKNLAAYLKMEEEIGDKSGIANAFNNIGLIYSNQGNYPEALRNLFASLKIKENIGDKRGASNAVNNIGLVYRSQGNYQEALKNYFASLKIKEEIGDKAGIANSYLNIGLTFWDQGNYPEALKNQLASLKISEEIGSKRGVSYSLNAIGIIYEKQGKYSEALENHLASLKIKEEIGDKAGIADSYNNIGETYTKMKKFPEADQSFNTGISLSKNIGLKIEVRNGYAGLARLDSAMGNWEGAYQSYKFFILYRDSLVNEQNTKKILQTQMQYEFDKKEDSLKYQQTLTNEQLKQQTLLTQQKEQSLLIKEKEFALMTNQEKLQQLEIDKNQADFAAQKAEADKKQGQLVILSKEKAMQTLQLKKQKQLKNYLLAGLVLFSILSFFVYSNYRTRQKLKVQTLRNKIASDLHDDVGSTLSSISIFSQMAQQQSKDVKPLLETIGESSRKMLDAMADIVWTIKPENDQFEKIILRMKNFAYELLGAKKIDFEFIADDDVAKMSLPMDVRKNLYLIFKEATNNMVKYSGADKATFSIKEENKNLIMRIHDNGKGFDINRSTEGNGLNNMKKRAEEIRGRFLIDSQPGNGTTLQLSVAI
jgi:signal transduction histidine kinase